MQDRPATRYPIIANAELVEMQSETHLQARTSDISTSGCYLDTINPFPAGTEIRIKIVHANATFNAMGKVIYAQPNMGMGVAFISVEPGQKAVLENWIKVLASS